MPTPARVNPPTTSADQIHWCRQRSTLMMSLMDDPSRLLEAYDAQLRTDAETPSALAVTHLGPVRL